jgi:hypothetical protein
MTTDIETPVPLHPAIVIGNRSQIIPDPDRRAEAGSVHEIEDVQISLFDCSFQRSFSGFLQLDRTEGQIIAAGAYDRPDLPRPA